MGTQAALLHRPAAGGGAYGEDDLEEVLGGGRIGVLPHPGASPLPGKLPAWGHGAAWAHEAACQ